MTRDLLFDPQGRLAPSFDHTSGLLAVVAEGNTIVTPEANKEFLMTALATNASSRTLHASLRFT
jgi:hypothetical protein